MRRAMLATGLASLLATVAAAQSHTIVALSHGDFTAYELDPGSGRILHQFTAANEPHEGLASPDGKTFYAAVPSGPHVIILDATTFKEKGKIKSEFFRRTARCGFTTTVTAPSMSSMEGKMKS